MVDRIKTYVNEGNVYYSLEVCEHANRTAFHLLQLERKKQELLIEQEEAFAEIEQVSGAVQKGAPLFLVINTGKVLVKILPATTEINQEALVHNAFPNLDFNSFYYELIRTKKNLIISICRKEHVDGYLEALSEQQLSVVQVSLGIASISNSLGYLPSGKLSLSNTDLTLQDGTLERMQPHGGNMGGNFTDYDVNGLKVKNTHLLGLSSVLGHVLKSHDTEGNLAEIKTHLSNEFRNKRHFKLLLRSALGFVLGLLLLNFLVFSYYFDKVGKLEEDLAVNNANKEQLLRLNADVNKKEERLNAVLAMSNSNTSAMLDAVAKNLPNSVLLNAMQYQPLLKPLRDTKAVELESNILTISGSASDSGDFYNWVAELEKLPWIDHVETTDYDYGTKNTSNFTIKIMINE